MTTHEGDAPQQNGPSQAAATAAPATGTTSKTQWRRLLRARRREAYSGTEGQERRRREGLALAEHAQALFDRAAGVDDSRPPRIAVFSPLSVEADVTPLVDALRALGADLLFPADAGGPLLDWVLWDGGEFLDSPGTGFGTEPTGRRLGSHALGTADLVLAPALAVDASGTRIGHGGGYYDRALVDVDAGRVLVIVHPQEVLESGVLPRERTDVPVRQVLTAQGLQTLGA